MSLSSSDRLSPSEMALQAQMAALWHDVVVAASKFRHGSALGSADRSALRWAGALLKRAAATDAVFTMSSAQQLVGTGQTLEMLRIPVQGADDEQAVLLQVQEGIRRALKGDTDNMVHQAMDLLRQIFAGASQSALRSQVQSHETDDPVGQWVPSETSSSS